MIIIIVILITIVLILILTISNHDNATNNNTTNNNTANNTNANTNEAFVAPLRAPSRAQSAVTMFSGHRPLESDPPPREIPGSRSLPSQGPTTKAQPQARNRAVEQVSTRASCRTCSAAS